MQTDGMEMGVPLSPILSNTLMAKLETEAVANAHHKQDL